MVEDDGLHAFLGARSCFAWFGRVRKKRTGGSGETDPASVESWTDPS